MKITIVRKFSSPKVGRTLLSILSLAAVATTLFAAEKGARIVCPNGNTVNVGLVDRESVIEDSVLIANAGDEPLVIYRAFSDCSCTSIKYPKEPIEPGDSIYLKVRFDTKGRSPGGFLKYVRLRSNDPQGQKTIYVKGDIRYPVSKNEGLNGH